MSSVNSLVAWVTLRWPSRAKPEARCGDAEVIYYAEGQHGAAAASQAVEAEVAAWRGTQAPEIAVGSLEANVVVIGKLAPPAMGVGGGRFRCPAVLRARQRQAAQNGASFTRYERTTTVRPWQATTTAPVASAPLARHNRLLAAQSPITRARYEHLSWCKCLLRCLSVVVQGCATPAADSEDACGHIWEGGRTHKHERLDKGTSGDTPHLPVLSAPGAVKGLHFQGAGGRALRVEDVYLGPRNGDGHGWYETSGEFLYRIVERLDVEPDEVFRLRMTAEEQMGITGDTDQLNECPIAASLSLEACSLGGWCPCPCHSC
jgi:hypothetical protein